jgi:dolichyl-phosphate-mannose-protein mannosyltransferase
VSYLRSGLFIPDSWWSPPLKHYLTAIATLLFGNDPVGWRLKDVLIGTLVVYLSFLLSRRLFHKVVPAVVTAVLVGLDPFMISIGHTTHEDPAAVCFVLLGTIFFVRDIDNGELRWYAVFALLPVAAYSVWRRRDDLAKALTAVTSYTLVPLSIYLLTYLPWISRGYSLADWVRLQLDAAAIQGPNFQLPSAIMSLAGANRWFVQWVGSGTAKLEMGRAESVSVLMNDPVLWILFVPSALLLVYVGWKRKRGHWTVVAVSFLLTYALFFFAPRPVILYSAAAVVPLGFVCVGFAATYLLKRRVWWFLAIAATWSLYLYPLVSREYLWRPPYEWLLRMMAG